MSTAVSPLLPPTLWAKELYGPSHIWKENLQKPEERRLNNVRYHRSCIDHVSMLGRINRKIYSLKRQAPARHDQTCTGARHTTSAPQLQVAVRIGIIPPISFILTITERALMASPKFLEMLHRVLMRNLLLQLLSGRLCSN
jgi:hypothetical protein